MPGAEPVIRGTVLQWFIRVAQTVLGLAPETIRYTTLDSLKSVESRAKDELSEIHLPRKVGTVNSLSDALDIIYKYINGHGSRCGKEADISGGFPPELTAEVAEYIRVFGGFGKEKRKFFDLCEDVVALAELGAFFSFCGRRRTETGRIEYHYVFTEVLGSVETLNEKLEYALNLRSVVHRLVENDAPLNTIALGVTTCIARYLSRIPYVTRTSLFNRGITFEYLRLEPGNVLRVSGFSILSVAELVKLVRRAGIVTPIYILIRRYPSKNDIERSRGLKKLKEIVDDIAKDLLLYVNNTKSVIASKDGRYVVVRDPIYLYNIVRRAKVFLDSLDKQTENLFDSYLKSNKYSIKSVLEGIVSGIGKIATGLR